MKLLQNEKVPVACYDAIRAGGYRDPENFDIVRIPTKVHCEGNWTDHICMFPQKLADVFNDTSRKLDFLPEISENLANQFLGEHNLMAVETKFHNGFTETARSESSNDDVGVKDYLHEMALKTSSSVRNP